MKKRIIGGMIVFLAIFTAALVSAPLATAFTPTPNPNPPPDPGTPWSWTSNEGTLYFMSYAATPTITQETGAAITITQVLPGSGTSGEPENFFYGQLGYTDPTTQIWTTVNFTAFRQEDRIFSFIGLANSTPVMGDLYFMFAPNSAKGETGFHIACHGQKSLHIRGAFLGTNEIFEGFFLPSTP